MPVAPDVVRPWDHIVHMMGKHYEVGASRHRQDWRIEPIEVLRPSIVTGGNGRSLVTPSVLEQPSVISLQIHPSCHKGNQVGGARNVDD